MERWVLPATERIFGEVCEDVLKSYRELGDELPAEFLIFVVPCWTEIRGAPFEILNEFKIVLGGAVRASELVTSSVNVLEVVEPGDGGRNNAHTFLITAMPFPSTATVFAIPMIWCFAFVGVATSGYPGSGPEIHERIIEMIKEVEGGIVHHRVIEVEKDPLGVVFGEMGPVLEIKYPDQLVPFGGH